MGENTIWKIEKIHSQPKYTANRIHGQDPWIQVGSGMVRISGNLPPHLQSEADLPVHMQGSASSEGLDITMEVIASVEKYENARMKFSTVPAFALAESRASDACCLFLVQKHTGEVSLFSSPGKFRPSSGINCRRGDAQPRPTSCDPCRSRAQPAGRRPCSLAVMRAS